MMGVDTSAKTLGCAAACEPLKLESGVARRNEPNLKAIANLLQVSGIYNHCCSGSLIVPLHTLLVQYQAYLLSGARQGVPNRPGTTIPSRISS